MVPANDDAAVDAALVDAQLKQLGERSALPAEVAAELDAADQLGQAAANYEPAARRAIACALGG